MRKIDIVDLIIWILLIVSAIFLAFIFCLYIEVIPTPQWLQAYIEATA